MKKKISLLFVLLLCVSLFGCQNEAVSQVSPAGSDVAANAAQPTSSDENAVSKLVEDFGKKLQSVSLLAPAKILKESIQENYGPYVTSALLQKWQNDPSAAPGRKTSSPWPDRIDILSMTYMAAEDTYTVQGEIIEITSADQAGTAAAKRPVTLGIVKSDGEWKIDSVTLGEYESNDAVVYRNTQYGFTFSLPEGWEGYKVLTDTWKGYFADDGSKVAATGPEVLIRHPQWTSETPRQDIPILVFTLDQWKSLQNETFNISAAPVGPSELGRNSKYVFALPARYNYSFPTGYQEVEQIISGSPLHPTETFQ